MLLGAILLTISVKCFAKWIIEKHTIEKLGYIAVVVVIAVLTTLKWIIYQNHDEIYLSFLLIGIILGVILGMVPKSNKILKNKNEHWFMHAIVMYFLLVIYAFASLFYCIEIVFPGSFTGYTEWTNFFSGMVEFLYFSVVTFATVGFGDIQPVSTMAKMAVCAEILVMFRTITLGALFISKDS